MKKLKFLALALAAIVNQTISSAATIEVQADKPGAKINPAMWGIFFEAINFGADGGLYAELVKNRSFEFPEPLMGWIKISPSLAKGELSVRTENPLNSSNPHYVRIESEGSAPFGISNEGFRGMGLRDGETYNFSAWARQAGDEDSILTVKLMGEDGTVLDSAQVTPPRNTW